MKKFIEQSLKLKITLLDPLEPRIFLKNYAKAFLSGFLIGGLLAGLSVYIVQAGSSPVDHQSIVPPPPDTAQLCQDITRELQSKMQTIQQQFDQCITTQSPAPVISPQVNIHPTNTVTSSGTPLDVRLPSPTIEPSLPVTPSNAINAPLSASQPLTSVIKPPPLPPLTHRDIPDDLPSPTHIPRPPAPPEKLRSRPSTTTTPRPTITTNESFSGKSFLLEVGEQKNLSTGLNVRLVAVSSRNTGQFCIVGLNNDQAQRIASGSTAVLKTQSGTSLKIFTKAVTISRCQITLP